MHPDEQLLRQVLDEAGLAYLLVSDGEHAAARLVATEAMGSPSGLLPVAMGSPSGLLPEAMGSPSGLLPEAMGSPSGLLPEAMGSPSGLLPEAYEVTIDVQPCLLRVRASAVIPAIDARTDLPMLDAIARDWGIGNLHYDLERARVVASVGLWTGLRASARRGLPARLSGLLGHLEDALNAVAAHGGIALAPDPDALAEPITLDALARVLEHSGQPYRRMEHLSSLAFSASPPGVGPIVVHLVVVDDWLIGVRVLTLPPRIWPDDDELVRVHLQQVNAVLPWGMVSFYPESRHCVFQGLIPATWARLDEDLVEFLVHAAIDASPLLVPPGGASSPPGAS